MRAIVALLFLAALSLAQVSEFSSNSLYANSLTPLISGTGYETQLNYHKVWIPENTLSVQTTFTTVGTDSLCDLYLYHNFQIVPCGTDFPVESGTVNPCQAGVYTEAWSSTPVVTASFGPGAGSNNEFSKYAVGAYLYMAVTRYSDSYDSQACPYTIYVNVTSCPVNQTGVYDSSADTVSCQYINVLTPSGTKNSAGVAVSGARTAVLKVDLPLDVSDVVITALSNSSSTYLLADNGYPTVYDDYYEYESDYAVANGSYYLATLNAYVPRSGPLYIVVEDDDNAFWAQVNISYAVCADGMGGFACTYTSKLLNSSYNNVVQYLNADPVNSLGEYGPLANFYFDFPQNSTMEVNVTATANAGPSGYFYYKRAGFPEHNSDYGYDLASSFDGGSAEYVTLALTWHNFYPGGRIYFGVQNTDDSSTLVNLNYTIVLAAAAGTTTSGSTTSGSTTSGSTTASTTSGSGSTTASTTSGSGSTTASTTSGSATTGSPAVSTTSDSGVAAITYSAVVIIAALVLVL